MTLEALKSPVVAVIILSLGIAYAVCLVIAGLIWVNHPGQALPDQLNTIINGGYTLLVGAAFGVTGVHVGASGANNAPEKPPAGGT
jgi:hypothetical protein